MERGISNLIDSCEGINNTANSWSMKTWGIYKLGKGLSKGEEAKQRWKGDGKAVIMA